MISIRRGFTSLVRLSDASAESSGGSSSKGSSSSIAVGFAQLGIKFEIDGGI
jgi:hypothetical protein